VPPRQTGRLTVGRHATWTSTAELSESSSGEMSEAGSLGSGNSGTQRKVNIGSWKPVPSEALVNTEKTLCVLYLLCSLKCVSE
jgi:hypothetical protein